MRVVARSLVVLSLVIAPRALAQDAPAEQSQQRSPARESQGSGVTLQQYLDALAQRRLLAAETGSVERLRELVRRGEQLYFDGLHDEAALLLFEVAESPRFADFVDLEEFRGAEYMLAGALEELGAMRTAERYLVRILSRGPEDPYFGPAYRRYVDVALAGGNPERAIAQLEELGDRSLPEDAANELRYLRGRAAYDESRMDEAESHFGAITRRSRFYANAQYLRGVIATRAGDLGEAEARFCSIVEPGEGDRFSFYVDDRYFAVRDLAWLALGRVAHEGNRADDAFYYYFQVPADSERVAEALFESAYAMYEGGDHDTAIDLLDQLEARFPTSPFADEAALLRGYVHLGRCEFDAADRQFRRFIARFEPIRRDVDRILRSPELRGRLYEDLLAEEQRQATRGARGEEEASAARSNTRAMLLAMLRVDPTFYELHADVRTLDAEAARAGRIATDLGALAARVSGGDRPRAASEAEEPYADEAAELRRDAASARAMLAAMTEQLDAMRRARADRAQVTALEREIQALSARIDAVERGIREADEAAVAEPVSPASGDGIDALFERDVAGARRLPRRVALVRARIVDAANAAAVRAVRDLNRRLSAELRRARIGRIDAVMGSKRRIEIQIQSLAAGRFPAELQDPLRMQGLLREDEEYWPFEGEYWADEFDETVPLEDLEESAEEE